MLNFKILVAVLYYVLAASMVQAAVKITAARHKLKSFAEPAHNTCVAETGIDDASINRVLNGVFVDEPVIKSYMACIFREGKGFTPEGELDNKPFGEVLTEDIKDETIANTNYCYDQVKAIESLEDKTFALMKCYYDLDPYTFIFF